MNQAKQEQTIDHLVRRFCDENQLQGGAESQFRHQVLKLQYTFGNDLSGLLGKRVLELACGNPRAMLYGPWLCRFLGEFSESIDVTGLDVAQAPPYLQEPFKYWQENLSRLREMDPDFPKEMEYYFSRSYFDVVLCFAMFSRPLGLYPHEDATGDNDIDVTDYSNLSFRGEDLNLFYYFLRNQIHVILRQGGTCLWNESRYTAEEGGTFVHHGRTLHVQK